MKELLDYLRELIGKGKKFLILGHPHADPDAAGSAIALGKILESCGSEVQVGVPSNLDGLTKSVLESIGLDIQIDPPLDTDVMVVLDTSSLDQLEKYSEKAGDEDLDIIFIDHHRPDEETRKIVDYYYADEEASSTVELILELGEEMGFTFTPDTALLMLTGIISDTGQFRFADGRTFKSVSRLLEFGADYRRALEVMKTPEDPSKRVAMLKAAKRSELHKAFGRWIVFSEIGAFESDAASMFVKIGADVSLVFSSNDEEIRGSARARSGVASKTHLHLGKLMSDLADEFGGTGGGHAGAAGLTTQVALDDLKERALSEMKEMLEPQG